MSKHKSKQGKAEASADTADVKLSRKDYDVKFAG